MNALPGRLQSGSSRVGQHSASGCLQRIRLSDASTAAGKQF